MRENTVWVANASRHDLTAAQGYGFVRVAIPGTANPFDIPALGLRVAEELRDFQATDYLLLAGNIVANVVAVAHLLTRFESIKLLIFNAKERTYYDRTVTREDITQ